MKTYIQDKLLYVVLDDIQTGNSFGLVQARELKKLFNQQNDFTHFVLTSSGTRFFCAGGNLKFYSQLGSKQEGIDANEEISEILSSIYQLNIPTLCILNGDSFGGGVELMSSFDTIIAQPHVLISLWQRRMGLSLGWGSQDRLVDRVGKATLKDLYLNCRELTSYSALKLGLIDSIVSEESTSEFVENWVKHTKELPKQPLVENKIDNFNHTAEIFKKLWLAEDHQQALKNFFSNKPKI